MKLLRDMTEPELKDLLNALASGVKETCERLEVENPLFALLLFNDPQISQYVANCERGDVIKALRECSNRLAAKEDVPRVEFPEGVGPTGDFPDGKFNEHDEGGLNLAVGSDRKSGKVLMTFRKPVAWIGMNAKEASMIADSLRWHANKMGA